MLAHLAHRPFVQDGHTVHQQLLLQLRHLRDLVQLLNQLAHHRYCVYRTLLQNEPSRYKGKRISVCRPQKMGINTVQQTRTGSVAEVCIVAASFWTKFLSNNHLCAS